MISQYTDRILQQDTIIQQLKKSLAEQKAFHTDPAQATHKYTIEQKYEAAKQQIKKLHKQNVEKDDIIKKLREELENMLNDYQELQNKLKGRELTLSGAGK